jgi:hypothetical protein
LTIEYIKSWQRGQYPIRAAGRTQESASASSKTGLEGQYKEKRQTMPDEDDDRPLVLDEVAKHVIPLNRRVKKSDGSGRHQLRCSVANR